MALAWRMEGVAPSMLIGKAAAISETAADHNPRDEGCACQADVLFRLPFFQARQQHVRILLQRQVHRLSAGVSVRISAETVQTRQAKSNASLNMPSA